MQPLSLRNPATQWLNPSAAGLWHLITRTAVALVFLLSLLILARRFAGALERPLTAAGLVATAIALALLAYVVRWLCLGLLWQRMAPAERLAMTWLPLASLLAFGSSLTLPGSGVAALTAFWTILAAEEAFWIGYRYRHGVRQRFVDAARSPSPEINVADASDSRSIDSPVKTGPGKPIDPAALPPAPSTLDPISGDVTQQLTRSEDEQGRETIRGLLRGRFTSGQRSLSLHVAFCPPLETVPECTLTQKKGTAVEINAGQVMPYGARIDLRRPKHSRDSEDVLIELYARTTGDDPAGPSN